MKEPRWILRATVVAIHTEQLAEHGGSDGLRDASLLDSALAKPQNVYAYEENPSIFRLAASYAFGIARNHAFVDGNKRTTLVVCRTFLYANGWTIKAARKDLYLTFLKLAEGDLPEAELAAWLEAHSVPV